MYKKTVKKNILECHRKCCALSRSCLCKYILHRWSGVRIPYLVVDYARLSFILKSALDRNCICISMKVYLVSERVPSIHVVEAMIICKISYIFTSALLSSIMFINLIDPNLLSVRFKCCCCCFILGGL